jgi:hypothetical protein
MMSNNRHGLYQEQTVFDHIGCYVFRLLRRRLGACCKPTWPEVFRALVAVYVLSAVGLITIGCLTASTWQQCAAVFLGAAFLTLTARQFVRLTSLAPVRERRRLNRKGSVANWPLPPSQATPVQPGGCVAAPPDFLAELRAAGVNVRIAQVLYKAGLQSAQCVRQVDDKRLLDIGGVGPATGAISLGSVRP